MSSRVLSSETTGLTAVEAGPIHRNTTHTRPQEGRTGDARALASRSEPSNSDNKGGSSDIDPESSSDNDAYSSEAE